MRTVRPRPCARPPFRSRAHLLAAAALVLIPATLAAQARTLRWRSLDVEARLEASGGLHVSERHRMVFDGPWNGGERVFRVDPGQRLELLSVARIDARTGEPVPLRAGGGDLAVDEFVLLGGRTLRWRARRPDDAPFRMQELTYLIEYRLSGVVFREDGAYAIDHDFAFADRPGVIERYSLRLRPDPAWQAAASQDIRWVQRAMMLPGESVIHKARLSWKGADPPPPVRELARPLPAAPPPIDPRPVVGFGWRAAAFSLFAGLAAVLWRSFDRREAGAGRYDPAPQVGPAWLEEKVFIHRPEVVGAAWDGQTGHAEAAALIAAMALEGKIERMPGPSLKLLVPRASLVDGERAFVDHLFVGGRDVIDAVTLRGHYARTGFHPAAAIAGRLDAAVRGLVGRETAAPLTLGLMGIIITMAVSLLAADVSGDEWLRGAGTLATCAFVASVALAGAYQWRLRGRPAAVWIPAPLVLGAAIAAAAAPTLLDLLSSLGATLALMALALRAARWRGGADELENRRNLRAARAFFQRRLAEPGARVEERWIPYLLAFELAHELDRWSVSAPAPPSTAGERPLETRPLSRSTHTGGPSWSPTEAAFEPGGGRFGGAGASGSWASAVEAFAVEAPAPPRSSSSSSTSWSRSSSSSSSTSSGGGSRTGGGSGGGW
jgi:uncharacterized membrane protein YgcG